MFHIRHKNLLTSFSIEHKKRTVFTVLFLLEGLLREGNGLGGALSCAGAALNALLSVDHIVDIAHIDRFYRTLSCAGAAGQAIVINKISHNESSICKIDLKVWLHCSTSLPKINYKK
jgi:hypothetical protein